MKKISCLLYCSLFTLVCSCQSQKVGDDLRSSILSKVAEIESQDMMIRSSEGHGKQGGFEINQYFKERELYIHEYYSNENDFLFKTYFFLKGELLFYEEILSKSYRNAEKSAKHVFKACFSDGNMYIIESKNYINEKKNESLIKKNIINASMRIQKDWEKGVPPQKPSD